VLSLSRILLPVDFSERSAGAARYAACLARHFNSELILLHVVPPLLYDVGCLEGGLSPGDLGGLRTEQARRDLDAFLSPELDHLDVQRTVLEGDPARTIVDFAECNHARLIVMPTHGYGPFRRFILGSNTAKVLHDSDVPVWTGIHMQEPLPAPVAIRHVLCAVDLGPQSANALAWAAWLQQEFDAKLTLLHCPPAAPDGAGGEDADWRVLARQGIALELSRLCDHAHATADCRIEAGDPAEAICRLAGSTHADALVIGRGSAAGVFGRLRTNAYSIIRQSPCPVVSV
jgi:nucleotide-binding universal stress UspA family protein